MLLIQGFTEGLICQEAVYGWDFSLTALKKLAQATFQWLFEEYVTAKNVRI